MGENFRPAGETRIVVLGASGRLGSVLVPCLQTMGHSVRPHTRQGGAPFGADLTDRAEVARLLQSAAPQVIINLAALTDVERCESRPQEAYRANALIVEHVTAWIRSAGTDCHLIQVSTDQVYDGVGPHVEDKASPSNYYALSKYAGELAALNIGATVLRTNMFGHCPSRGRATLSDWLFNALQQRSPVTVFEDVQFSPLSMRTLSELIDRVVHARPSGLFNLGSHDGLSKADFAFAFAAEIGLPTDTLRRGTSSQLEFIKAYRPKDMRMDVSKFERAMEVRLPRLQDEIERSAKDYRDLT